MGSHKIIGAVPLEGLRLLVCMDSERIFLSLMRPLLEQAPGLSRLQSQEFFDLAQVEPGGSAVIWPEGYRIEWQSIQACGTQIPLERRDFLAFCRAQLVSTAEAAEILHCTRQNIDSLVRRGRLRPVKSYAKNKLFLRSDILWRLWGENGI